MVKPFERRTGLIIFHACILFSSFQRFVLTPVISITWDWHYTDSFLEKWILEPYLYIVWIIYGYSCLTLMYYWRDCSTNTFRLSLIKEYFNTSLLITLFEIGDIFGKGIARFSITADRFEETVAESSIRLMRLHHVDVFYDNTADRERFQNQYQYRFKRVRFHDIFDKKNLLAKQSIDNDDTHQQLNNDPLTTTSQLSSIADGVSSEPILTHDANSTATESLKTPQNSLNQAQSNTFTFCSICTEQVVKNKIQEHYWSETHQQALLKFLVHTIKLLRDQQRQMEYPRINNSISNVSNDLMIVNNTIQQGENEFQTRQESLQVLVQELNSVQSLANDNEDCLYRMTAVLNISDQEIGLLKQQLEHRPIIPMNGTFTWKINDIERKIDDAIFERQKSIYSPVFYSSSTGYKMCSRLFLNGVTDTHETHISIFFILMRNKYDALLKWPFPYKVSFTLLDQSICRNDQIHLTHSFWSDVRSTCFQRPRSDMNEAYGIQYFISFEQFRQHQHRYVKDDAIFIKIDIDFTSIPPTLISDSGRMLQNDEQHTDTNDDEAMRRFLFMIENPNQIQ